MKTFKNVFVLIFILSFQIIPGFCQQGQALLQVEMDTNGNTRILEIPGGENKHQSAASNEKGSMFASDNFSNNNGATSAPNLSYTSASWFDYFESTLAIFVKVKNIGDGPVAGPSILGYYLSENTTITTDDFEIGTDEVPALEWAKTSYQQIYVDLADVPGLIRPEHSALNQPVYYVGFIVDKTNQVVESNEGDNVYHWDSPTVTFADLFPTLAYVSFCPPVLSIAVWINNSGFRHSIASSTGYYLAKTNNWGKKYFIGKNAVRPLLYGESIFWEFSVDVSTLNTLPTGTNEYHVIIKADYTDEVLEIREDNNEIMFWGPINITRDSTGIDANSRTDELTSKVILYQNYPNPSNPSTTIQYTIPETDKVLLKIFDINGKKIQTLINAIQTPEFHSVIWDGKDNVGRNVSSGVYFYRLETSVHQETRKMLLLR